MEEIKTELHLKASHELKDAVLEDLKKEDPGNEKRSLAFFFNHNQDAQEE